MRPRLPGSERSYAQPNFEKEKGEDMRTLARLWKEEEGQDLIEYALLVALMALATAATFPTVATAIDNILTTAKTCLSAGTAASC
jgi:Flp pilus assembly pilin Flp